ncbi:MAG: hypothetical protein GXW89_13210 [Phycisphaerae bacterium]|nr:hypothetical protein [Phycisphaerae bacterium]
MRRHALLAGWIVTVCFLATGCSKDKESKPRPEPGTETPAAPVSPDTAPAPDTSATGTAPSVEAPTTGPGDVLESIESLSVSLLPSKGRALVVLFWNLRDSSMADQAKASIVLYRRFRARGLDMVSICTGASEDRVINFAERWQFPWPQVLNDAAADPKPFDRFKIDKTPAGLLLVAGADPVPLDLSAVDETHAAVARALSVNLADLPMPKEPSRYTGERSSPRLRPADELRTQIAAKASTETIVELVVRTLEEDDSRAQVDEAVDVLCGSMRKNYAPVIEQALQQISPEARIRMIRAVMIKSVDKVECVFPAVRKMKADEPALANVPRWDASQLGRAMVLAGEFDNGAKLLRKLAEETETAGAWWYMVGWAELCGGRSGPAKEAFEKSFHPDGKYDSAAARLAGSMSGYFLGWLDEKALIEAHTSKTGQFFIAERHMQAGDTARAVEAYKACIKAGEDSTDHWPCNWAQVRLKQIEGKIEGLPKPLPSEDRLWEQSATTQPGTGPAT